MQADSDIPHPHKLLEQVVDRLRVKHYSLRTEKTYVDWIKRFIWFHGKRQPCPMWYEPEQGIVFPMRYEPEAKNLR